jgi:hypothetical protein
MTTDTPNERRKALEADFARLTSPCQCSTCLHGASFQCEQITNAMLEGMPSWMPGEPKRVLR